MKVFLIVVLHCVYGSGDEECKAYDASSSVSGSKCQCSQKSTLMACEYSGSYQVSNIDAKHVSDRFSWTGAPDGITKIDKLVVEKCSFRGFENLLKIDNSRHLMPSLVRLSEVDGLTVEEVEHFMHDIRAQDLQKFFIFNSFRKPQNQKKLSAEELLIQPTLLDVKVVHCPNIEVVFPQVTIFRNIFSFSINGTRADYSAGGFMVLKDLTEFLLHVPCTGSGTGIPKFVNKNNKYVVIQITLLDSDNSCKVPSFLVYKFFGTRSPAASQLSKKSSISIQFCVKSPTYVAKNL